MIRRAVLVLLCIASGCRPAPALAGAPGAEVLTRAVMNEAEGEPYQSKLAHAFLFVNRARAGLSIGSSGLDSKKVRARLQRASVANWTDAKMAVQVALSNGVPDPTRGGLYCENVRAFGVPAYIRRALRAGTVEQCAKVGNVVFWRDKK
jgi:hypothetical protein